MNIGLMDVDSHNFPNLALMKLSAWHKRNGDSVEWYNGFSHYDRVYMSKVFDEQYTPDMLEPVNTTEIIRGGRAMGLIINYHTPSNTFTRIIRFIRNIRRTPHTVS